MSKLPSLAWSDDRQALLQVSPRQHPAHCSRVCVRPVNLWTLEVHTYLVDMQSLRKSTSPMIIGPLLSNNVSPDVPLFLEKQIRKTVKTAIIF